MLQAGKNLSEVFPFSLATHLATDVHPVANPVIAPDGTVITTISGARGQQDCPSRWFGLRSQGDRIPLPMRHHESDGTRLFQRRSTVYIQPQLTEPVLRYTNFENLEVIAGPWSAMRHSLRLERLLYVGDRTGKIHRIDSSGNKDEFARLEPSISAYHLAVDAEDRLYLTGPTFAMRDSLSISRNGEAEILIEGLQGRRDCFPSGRRSSGLCRLSREERNLPIFSHQRCDPPSRCRPHSRRPCRRRPRDLVLASSSSIYWLQLSGQATLN